jgi:protein-disulfide isomerase
VRTTNLAHPNAKCALGANINAIEECIHGGAAFARLAGYYQNAGKMRIEGSPSFVSNEGRQKLYGNVGSA